MTPLWSQFGNRGTQCRSSQIFRDFLARGSFCRYSTKLDATRTNTDEGEFRVLDIARKRAPRNEQRERRKKNTPILPPRADRMPIDQDWGNVWPTSRTFHPATVPLPLRMGYSEKGVAPGKFANAELMKIPNFLHLTPPVVARQCEALKKFCTSWPSGLETEKDVQRHFPLEFATCSYLHSGTSIRDPNARIVTLKFKLSTLNLDKRSKDKYLRLLGEKYDAKTDTVTIVVDRCPSRQQNLDFARYVFSVLFMEAKQVEDWESEKKLHDLEEFVWSGSTSENNALALVNKIKASKSCPNVYQSLPSDPSADEFEKLEVVQEYSRVLKTVLEDGETNENWVNYGKAVEKLLDIPRVESSR
ncbi:unnamed protein product [Notodromas monacha]|uniref:Small ribosomal subunit protein mS35 mitochondrial conserved domain-containing protein n=1 Tax=Notodromas monacha TaxID=399045 RepID=A0A7R9BT15_9CRUS|nr:unnamed protein product [Notodromas monacha]CAG0919589.1 unnamed protein product [Notodromas monacha]